MALILNIETATELCSVCISDENNIISIKETNEPYVHSKMITHLIMRAIEEAKLHLKDLDAVAISEGPGSYTALRVGASVAKGICYALEKPLIVIDTLQAIAWASREKENIEGLYCPMIDARRMEVYCKLFDTENKAVTKVESRIIDESSYSDYFESNKRIIFCGNGAEKCQQVIKSPLAIFSQVYCSASNMATLSQRSFQEQQFSELAYFVPNYHKSPNITTPKKRVL
ncbi:tRNA (adenosine(37)-N6)-threonylcarbamoyltransferase complex dimerization subunit type 1 TsaB [Saprospiraceae bacterium]|jgi:tRNA threonylcarbamoyladenosine biosynthesis protein TsaB|nr:tRNA (adenosine(37)-N6)-threonylcarbamoyltransferase complex dimerization subunit type 1 TsaB [Bacteroidota bacterium]MDB4727691.1 tRNA (adenosine(37)-N6)-threonylcarbamoyltransferase complex dimerization subunit type 1 TsaB [Saprospiraceae bacterium]MDF1863459.1 tRNA (adenosine(37)-N6)-threonylcarbamoyltransferase complex dimerization subunit type 1 TsaB [Saprospiraceae bacterium]